GGAQSPVVKLQLKLQHSADSAQPCPSAAHGVVHTSVPRSFARHLPLQQSASAVQPTPCAWQIDDPKTQRSLFCLSQTSQQPLPLPEVHVSPVGRQSGLAWSILHSCFCGSQMFEQQSELAVHESLSILHSPPPHTPPKQPSEQQSSALVQGTPSARQ